MLLPFTASVETPVIIALSLPSKVVTVPSRAIEVPVISEYTPFPTVTPIPDKLVVAIPIIWSPRSSIKQIFNPFAQVPGVFAAKLKLLADEKLEL